MAGYVITFVLPPRQVVVRVDDVEYTRADIVKLLRARQRGIEYLGGQLNAGTDIIRAVQLLVENEIIARSAPKFGISVSDIEVEAERRRLLALGTDQSSGQDSDQAQREAQERYRAYLNTIQMDEAAHRQLIENRLLREKLRQYLGESVPLVTEQVRLHRIVLSPEDKIEVMRAKFNEAAGDTTAPERLREAFEQVVRGLSRDSPDNVRKGGDLGWVPAGVYREHDRAFFDLETGKLSDPTLMAEMPGRLVSFMVSERAQAQELHPKHMDTLKTRALQDWLNKARDDHDVHSSLDSETYDWLIEQLGSTSSGTAAPQSNLRGF